MTRWALRFGLMKGVLGGSRPWRAVFAGALALRAIQRITHDEPEVVLSEPLGAGQAIVVTHEQVTVADDRKAQRRARRRARRERHRS